MLGIQKEIRLFFCFEGLCAKVDVKIDEGQKLRKQRGRRLVWYKFLGDSQENMVTVLKFQEPAKVIFTWHRQETPYIQQARTRSYARFFLNILSSLSSV